MRNAPLYTRPESLRAALQVPQPPLFSFPSYIEFSSKIVLGANPQNLVDFRGQQLEVIFELLEGDRDLVYVAPTGEGKSLLFQVAAKIIQLHNLNKFIQRAT